MITDSHAHVYGSSFDTDREEVLARARRAGVTRLIVVGTDVASSRAALELCAGRSDLFPSAGIHPHDAAGTSASDRAAIEEMCRLPECVAVGETGLDYFKELSPRTAQIENFHWQADLARRVEKPLVVHCRDAHGDVSRILAEHHGITGVMHCYTLGPAELEPYLALGFCISFSGVVTYPKNDANRAAARAVPADRLLIETDCPYLAPQAQRGKRNEPAFAREILEAVAHERREDVVELGRRTSTNAARLFGLAPLEVETP